MLEILEFIFKSFWRFIGTVILLETIFGGLRGMFTKVTVAQNESETSGHGNSDNSNIEKLRPKN